MAKRVIVSVTNDLSTDQRVNKVCLTLVGLGYQVFLVGRKRRKSEPLEQRNYHCKRMFLFFEKGPLFYLEYQVRLFCYLLFTRSNVLVSNDLDTLLPNYIVSRLKRLNLVYDSHEYFTEVPELQSSPVKKRMWKTVEKYIFPKLKHVFTVNDSIKNLYEKEYGVEVKVVRNLPLRPLKSDLIVTRSELQIPESGKLIILQGAGINVDRGAEEAVEAMKLIDDAFLLIVGNGDVVGQLKNYVQSNGLKSKVFFLARQSFDRLRAITKLADVGLTLDKDSNLNYRYSLPNKLFDYIHAGVPVLSSRLVEIEKVFAKYDIGLMINNHSPAEIASKLKMMLTDTQRLAIWKVNLSKAAHELCWENEEKVLDSVYKKFL